MNSRALDINSEPLVIGVHEIIVSEEKTKGVLELVDEDVLFERSGRASRGCWVRSGWAACRGVVLLSARGQSTLDQRTRHVNRRSIHSSRRTAYRKASLDPASPRRAQGRAVIAHESCSRAGLLADARSCSLASLFVRRTVPPAAHSPSQPPRQWSRSSLTLTHAHSLSLRMAGTGWRSSPVGMGIAALRCATQ